MVADGRKHLKKLPGRYPDTAKTASLFAWKLKPSQWARGPPRAIGCSIRGRPQSTPSFRFYVRERKQSREIASLARMPAQGIALDIQHPSALTAKDTICVVSVTGKAAPGKPPIPGLEHGMGLQRPQEIPFQIHLFPIHSAGWFSSISRCFTRSLNAACSFSRYLEAALAPSAPGSCRP